LSLREQIIRNIDNNIIRLVRIFASYGFVIRQYECTFTRGEHQAGAQQCCHTRGTP